MLGGRVKGQAKIALSCDSFDDSGQSKEFNFHLVPDFAETKYFPFSPALHSIVAKVWNGQHTGIKKEITQFKAECVPFDPSLNLDSSSGTGEEESSSSPRDE